MKLLQSIRYKSRVGLLLATLLACLLINNIVGQESFDTIQQDARSIYEDRLMPSTFIFELREHLYKARELRAGGVPDGAALRELRAQSEAIAGLVRRYEKTALTPDERREWLRFKSQLTLLQRPGAADAAFSEALVSLTHLNAIQAGEAKGLESRLMAAANASSLRAYFEIGLLIAIGALTLSLIGYSRNVYQQTVSHRPSLN